MLADPDASVHDVDSSDDGDGNIFGNDTTELLGGTQDLAALEES